MPFRIHVGHSKSVSTEQLIRDGLRQTKSRSFGVAVAYTSTYGAAFLRKLSQELKIAEVRLITDVRDGVTHPQALRIALEEDWRVRVVNGNSTFHPKFYVGGGTFGTNGLLSEPRMLLLGSNNLSRNGLNLNTECCYLRTEEIAVPSFAVKFQTLWNFGTDLDGISLDQYEDYFEARNKARSVADLSALGVSDTSIDIIRGARRERPLPTMSQRVAKVAWTGLESSTGERRFQPEFPRRVGEMVEQMIRSVGLNADNFDALCEDGVSRSMKYSYYDANSMYRLNVPNDVPGVEEAREKRTGVIRLEIMREQNPPIGVQVCLDSDEIEEMLERSRALGTLGETSTRFYGWY